MISKAIAIAGRTDAKKDNETMPVSQYLQACSHMVCSTDNLLVIKLNITRTLFCRQLLRLFDDDDDDDFYCSQTGSVLNGVFRKTREI